MTLKEVQAHRAALMPQLEKLLLSLRHWRRTHKMKTNYSHEDLRGSQTEIIPFPAAPATKH
jgi:hypothetical protein